MTQPPYSRRQVENLLGLYETLQGCAECGGGETITITLASLIAFLREHLRLLGEAEKNAEK